MSNPAVIKARPSAPPPPPPPGRTPQPLPSRATESNRRMTADSPVVPEAYRSRLRRCSGANNRHCNGSNQSVASIRPPTTYEVYHINNVGLPQPPKHVPRANGGAYIFKPTQERTVLSSVADLSQGSCDNTPATPDSLDSLVGCSGGEDDEDSAVSSQRLQSDDACSSDRLQCTSSVLSPLSTASVDIDSNDNNNTIKRSPRPPPNGSQKDNLIEELTTLISRPQSPCVMSSRASSSTSNGSSHGAMSSSLTPSTVVPTVTIASSDACSASISSKSNCTPIVMNTNASRYYYFDGGNNAMPAAAAPNVQRHHEPPPHQSMVYEQLTSTMLRRSRSQQQMQPPPTGPRSVGHTPPLPVKHNAAASPYMPLAAYDYQQINRPGHQLRRSNPQIHYATELVLTPQQAHQIQQSLVNRYATIGRNYHISVGTKEPVKADVHYHRVPPPPPPAAATINVSEETLAMRINNNLINCPTMTMKRSATVPDNKALLEAPLTDVNRLHEVTTPPTVSMTSRRIHPRLSSSDDILSADSTTECGDEDARLSPDEDFNQDQDLEEEKVRKHTLLSTLVMPRPQRKPPFTIEGAMSRLLRRNKKKEEAPQADGADKKPKKTPPPTPPPPLEDTESGLSSVEPVKSRLPPPPTSDEETTIPNFSDSSDVAKKIKVGVFSC